MCWRKKKAEQVAIIEVAENSAEIATGLNDRRQLIGAHLSNKRADAVKEGKKDVLTHARLLPLEAWINCTSSGPCIFGLTMYIDPVRELRRLFCQK